MKRNLGYLAILALLLTFTYFYQERGLWSKVPKSLTHNLQLNELESIEFHDGMVALKPTPLIQNLSFPADIPTLKDFLKTLGYINLKKEIAYTPEAFKNYFPPDAKKIVMRRSNLQELVFVLGEQVPGEEDFYWLERKGEQSKLYIATFEELLAPGQNQYYEQRQKYQQIQKMLGLTANFFFSPQVFTESEQSQIKRMSYVLGDKEIFSLSLDKEQKNVANYGLKFKDEKLEQCKQELLELKGESIVSATTGTLPVSAVIFHEEGGASISLKLYLLDGEKTGYYVAKDDGPVWYSLGVGKEVCMMMRPSDYWQKSLPITETKDLHLLTRTNKKYAFDSLVHSQVLSDLILSKGPFKEADRLTSLMSPDPRTVGPGLSLEWGKVKLFLTLKKDEILLINRSEAYVLHYYLTPERSHLKLSIDEKDYLP